MTKTILSPQKQFAINDNLNIDAFIDENHRKEFNSILNLIKNFVYSEETFCLYRLSNRFYYNIPITFDYFLIEIEEYINKFINEQPHYTSFDLVYYQESNLNDVQCKLINDAIDAHKPYFNNFINKLKYIIDPNNFIEEIDVCYQYTYSNKIHQDFLNTFSDYYFSYKKALDILENRDDTFNPFDTDSKSIEQQYKELQEDYFILEFKFKCYRNGWRLNL